MSDHLPEPTDPAVTGTPSGEPGGGSGGDTPGPDPQQQPAAPPPQDAPPQDPAPSPAPPAEAAGGGGGSGKAGPGPEGRKRRRRRGRKAPGAEGPPPAGGKGARKRGGAPRGRGQDRPRSQHHASQAVRALAEMASSLLEVEGVDLLARPRHVAVHVRVPLEGGRALGKAARAVVEQILERVQEVREHEKALVPGSVYCYFSQRSDADTSRPSGPREVFEGYTSTGKPRFTDFVTMAIERKDPGIDVLLAGEDVIITHVTMGRVLRTQQLAEFGEGSPVYKILGQVDAGLFPVLTGAHKAAFSFQLLRGTTLEGKPRLRLHAVGACDLMDIADPTVPLLLSRFQRRLDEESLRLGGLRKNAGDQEVDEEEFVLPLLQELSRQLAGRARRKSRRTEHAQQRSDERERPTTKAYEDARGAPDERLLLDDAEGTVVVLGPRGRVHVFTPEAKHVTSLMMQGSSIGKRRQQGRWRPAEPDERGEFRIHLQHEGPGTEGG